MRNEKIKGFCFRYGIFWIGWFLERKTEEPSLWYDDNLNELVSGEFGIPYMTIGLTERGVIKRLRNRWKRRVYANS